MFAEINLAPGGILAWLVVGLIAGWLAGVFMKGSGFGVVWDMIVGLVGALIGGVVFGLFVQGGAGFWGGIGGALVGARLLIAIVPAVGPGPHPPRLLPPVPR